jgi:RNA polymerase sigma factor (sigma-70 family)
MKKPKPVPKGKKPALTDKEKAEVLGIECAGLLAIIKEGKDGGAAKGKLFILCNGGFIRVAFKHYRHKQNAEDAVSDAWKKFWEDLADGTYKEGNTFVGYVNTSIGNAHKKSTRASKNKTDNMEEGDDFEDKSAEKNESPEYLWEILDPEIEKLPPNFKIIVNMTYKENKKDPEIAELLGVGEDYIRSARSKALTLLRKRIGALKIIFE